MKVQNINAVNCRKQQNFTGVSLLGADVAKISEEGVKSLLRRMDTGSHLVQEVTNALKHLVKVDDVCSPDNTFQVAVSKGGKNMLIILGHPERIARPCSVCEVKLFPLETLAKRLTGAYCAIKADYINPKEIHKFDNWV